MVLDNEGKTHYDVLGVKPDCSVAEAKSAFRQLAKETHPDSAVQQNSKGHGNFLRISEAIKVVGNPMLRASYDHDLSRHGLLKRNPHVHSFDSSAAGDSSYDMDLENMSTPVKMSTARTSAASERQSIHYYRAQRRAPLNDADRAKRLQERSVKMHSAKTLSIRLAVPMVVATALLGGIVYKTSN